MGSISWIAMLAAFSLFHVGFVGFSLVLFGRNCLGVCFPSWFSSHLFIMSIIICLLSACSIFMLCSVSMSNVFVSSLIMVSFAL